MHGWCYVMTNQHMPGLVKIGWTSRSPSDRASELYTTAIPDLHQIEYAAEAVEADLAEKSAHTILKSTRVNSSREYFRCSVKDAMAVVRESSQTFGLVSERFYSVEREEAEALQRDRETSRTKAIDEEMNRARVEARKQASVDQFAQWVTSTTSQCRNIYRPLISQTLRSIPWWTNPTLFSIGLSLLSAVTYSKPSFGNSITLGVIAGTVVWWFRDGSKTDQTVVLENELAISERMIAERQLTVCNKCNSLVKLNGMTGETGQCERCREWFSVPSNI